LLYHFVSIQFSISPPAELVLHYKYPTPSVLFVETIAEDMNHSSALNVSACFPFRPLSFLYLGLNWEENILVRDEDWLSSLEERVVAAPVRLVYCYGNKKSGCFSGQEAG
jgi:hypothetical protein